MSKDLYASLSGAMAAWRQIEIIGNNLANATAGGFKEQRAVFQAVGNGEGALAASYVRNDEIFTNMANGPLQDDGIDTHLALIGRGFFVVEGDNGRVLQRAGSFQLDGEGRLATAQGALVMGEGGAIEIPDRQSITVAADGTVSTRDGEPLDKLLLLDADELEPIGASQWRSVGPTRTATEVEVMQGALEGSNIDPVRGMVELVEATRYFDAYQRAMTASDELDARIYDTVRP